MRKSKNYFLSGVTGSLGRLFRTGNKPDEQTFRNLFDSILFFSEKSDSAQRESPGHAKIESDDRAKTRSVPDDDHTKFVQAHQLTELSVEGVDDVIHASSDDNNEVLGKGISIKSIVRSIGDLFRRNYLIKILYHKSIDVGDNKLQLKNDQDDPGSYKYYGTNSSGEKGYHGLMGYVRNILTRTDVTVTEEESDIYEHLYSISRNGDKVFTDTNVISFFYGNFYLHKGTSRDYHITDNKIYLHPDYEENTDLFIDIIVND